VQKIAVIAVAALLSGCAVTYDAVQTGPNRYQVSSVASPARGGRAGAETRATAAAGKKCVSMGKTVNVLEADDHWVFPANASVAVTFECN